MKGTGYGNPFWQRRFEWVFAGTVLLVPVITKAADLSKVVVLYEGDRWLHFLAYMMLTALPLVRRRWWIAFRFILLITILGGVSECVRALIPGALFRLDCIVADLLGAVAGTLLGLNIRMMQLPPNAAGGS